MIHYLIMGLIQGLTEFLPVSSSGHLVIGERFLRLDPPGVLLEAILHLGTLVAVLILFRRDILRLARGLFTKRREFGEISRLIVGTIPITVIGFVLQDKIDAAFSSLLVVGICLLVTGGLLLIADRAGRQAKRKEVRLRDALLIGISQAAALLPGISRSGATISTGMIVGIKGREAARFSFLLSIPAILGAAGLKLYQALTTTSVAVGEWPELLVGALTALAVGVVAIKGLLALISRGKLKIFGIYCLVIGLSTIIYLYVW